MPDLVDLRERARNPVRAFSGGMKQRFMVARALLHHAWRFVAWSVGSL